MREGDGEINQGGVGVEGRSFLVKDKYAVLTALGDYKMLLDRLEDGGLENNILINRLDLAYKELGDKIIKKTKGGI